MPATHVPPSFTPLRTWGLSSFAPATVTQSSPLACTMHRLKQPLHLHFGRPLLQQSFVHFGLVSVRSRDEDLIERTLHFLVVVARDHIMLSDLLEHLGGLPVRVGEG